MIGPPDDPFVAQVVLYYDPDSLPGGYGDVGHIEHHVEQFTEAQVDMTDALGIGYAVFLPDRSGTAGAVVLARLIEETLNKHRLDPRDRPRVELFRRLRSLALACYNFPRDSVKAHTLPRA